MQGKCTSLLLLLIRTPSQTAIATTVHKPRPGPSPGIVDHLDWTSFSPSPPCRSIDVVCLSARLHLYLRAHLERHVNSNAPFLHLEMSSATSMKLAFAVLFHFASFHFVVAAPAGWGDGRITYYGSPNGGGTQGGACGYQNTPALGYGYMTAALSTPLFKGGAACGACYQLQCARVQESRTVRNWCWDYARTITVTATNLCPPGSEGGWCDPPRHHFDLPMPAFLTLARQEGGVVPVFYRRVKCVKKGGVRFTMGGNPWFYMVLIHNVGGAGDVVAVQIKCPSTGWVAMYRNWGSLWTVQKKMDGPLSFQITTSDNRVLITTNAVGAGWKFGQTWEGAQYR